MLSSQDLVRDAQKGCQGSTFLSLRLDMCQVLEIQFDTASMLQVPPLAPKSPWANEVEVHIRIEYMEILHKTIHMTKNLVIFPPVFWKWCPIQVQRLAQAMLEARRHVFSS